MLLLCIYSVIFKIMLPQDMKRCSVCTLRKSDRHFIRKERIWRSCNECSISRKRKKKSIIESKVEPKKETSEIVDAHDNEIVKKQIKSKSIKYIK